MRERQGQQPSSASKAPILVTPNPCCLLRMNLALRGQGLPLGTLPGARQVSATAHWRMHPQRAG